MALSYFCGDVWGHCVANRRYDTLDVIFISYDGCNRWIRLDIHEQFETVRIVVWLELDTFHFPHHLLCGAQMIRGGGHYTYGHFSIHTRSLPITDAQIPMQFR